MHEPMCPIKISIVQQKGKHHGQNEIAAAVPMDVSVNKRVFYQRAEKESVAERSKN